MTELETSPFAVCVLPEPPPNAARTVSYPNYVHEILGHAGICYSSVAVEDLADALPYLRLLLTVGETDLPEGLADKLQAWVRGGGAWLSAAGVCGAADMFGVEQESPAYYCWGSAIGNLGEGYVNTEKDPHPVVAHLSIPLHYFNGIAVRATEAESIASVVDAHQRPSPRAAITECSQGKGRCMLIAPDVTGTVVRIQQGIGVTRDGVPSADGTALQCDNVLKSADGAVLDWIFDRQDLPGVPGMRAFLQPIADQWRELLLRAVFYLAERQEFALPVLWLYPRNLPALGHISHDTDGNDPDKARRLLEALDTAKINTTWCVMAPGYSPDIIDAIRRAGHELAMHYDAMSDGTAWSEQEFDAQWRVLVELFGERPVSNKNHFTRWEGDIEFFEWCAERGIQLDQSKGISKTGEAGFNFGACHPYRPVDPRGEVMDILELPVTTMDLIHFAPTQLADAMLAAARKHHGVLHLLFHPGHIEKPGIADTMLSFVQIAKDQGTEWWTARQISEWERARRQVRWQHYERTPNGARVHLQVGDPLPQATVMLLAPSGSQVAVDEADCKAKTVERWGSRFQAVTLDLEPNKDHTIEWRGK